MKKYHVFLAAVVAGGMISVNAQETNTPVPPPMATTNTLAAQRFNAMRTMTLRNAIVFNERAAAELQKVDGDFGGKRQEAIDACNKAKDELTALAKEMGITLPQSRPMPGRPMHQIQPAPVPAGTPAPAQSGQPAPQPPQ